MAKTFVPQFTYGQPGSNGQPIRAMVAPPKYVQGSGVLENFHRFAKLHAFKRFGLLASARGHTSQAGVIRDALTNQDLACIPGTFQGECSLAEIDRQVDLFVNEELDCLVAVGGGKCVDAGKCIAHRLDIPVIIVPTLASNDAPCSALSVIYSEDGVVSGGEFFPHSPILVLVDTAVIADAQERYLAAGMGDAMATWYEARVCAANPDARNILGARPTLTAGAMGELCAHTLYAHGVDACGAVRAGRVTDALEHVVEANTLLSGVGFESGGLAGAHAYAQGFTVLPDVERNYLHGEMVGMGVIAQLMLEQNESEARRVAAFFASIGLPVHLEQIGMTAQQHERIDQVVAGAMTFQPLANFAFEVTARNLRDALLAADSVGAAVAADVGDQAYRRLQS